ncbi:MAG: hypothetical protein RMI89_04290 [Gloeomargarita sp. SKYBB_i_bin120]|nr:hypothetical protein [Gloeomargarita sp. SKYB120]MDW8177739.1 hypothetical protein [Gloeomargarita sp. SKYBB_i_bin120]
MTNSVLQVIGQAVQSPLTLPWILLSSGLAILSVLLRLLLFRKLESLIGWAREPSTSEYVPQLVRKLEIKVSRFLQSHDEVNTSALIERELADEPLLHKLSLEKAEYVTGVVPNLLIAVGLLGTFLGIAISLNAVRDTLARPDLNLADLTSELSKQIDGMTVAFISSLVSLLWGIILVVVNSIWNTTIARRKLFANLEILLDHELEIQDRSPTTRLIRSIENNFRVFLDSFYETVRSAIEKPLERQIGNLTELNRENAELARQIYIHFGNAAGNLLTGANTFQTAAQILSDSQFAEKVSAAATQASQFTNQLIAITHSSLQLNSTVAELNQKVESLIEIVNQSQIDFQRVVQDIKSAAETFTHIRDVAHHLLERVREAQGEIIASSSELSQVALKLSDATATLHAARENLSECVQSLQSIQEEVSQNRKQIENQNQLLNQELGSIRQGLEQYKEQRFTWERGYSELLSHLQQQLNQLTNKISGVEQYLQELNSFAHQLINQELVSIKNGLEQYKDQRLTWEHEYGELLSNLQQKLSKLTNETADIKQCLQELRNFAYQLDTRVSSQASTQTNEGKSFRPPWRRTP